MSIYFSLSLLALWQIRAYLARHDPIKLTKMLRILFMALEDPDWTGREAGLEGMELVLALLLDKLEIASGEYKFPFLAIPVADTGLMPQTP